ATPAQVSCSQRHMIPAFCPHGAPTERAASRRKHVNSTPRRTAAAFGRQRSGSTHCVSEGSSSHSRRTNGDGDEHAAETTVVFAARGNDACYLDASIG